MSIDGQVGDFPVTGVGQHPCGLGDTSVNAGTGVGSLSSSTAQACTEIGTSTLSL